MRKRRFCRPEHGETTRKRGEKDTEKGENWRGKFAVSRVGKGDDDTGKRHGKHGETGTRTRNTGKGNIMPRYVAFYVSKATDAAKTPMPVTKHPVCGIIKGAPARLIQSRRLWTILSLSDRFREKLYNRRKGRRKAKKQRLLSANRCSNMGFSDGIILGYYREIVAKDYNNSIVIMV